MKRGINQGMGSLKGFVARDVVDEKNNLFSTYLDVLVDLWVADGY